MKNRTEGFLQKHLGGLFKTKEGNSGGMALYYVNFHSGQIVKAHQRIAVSSTTEVR